MENKEQLPVDLRKDALEKYQKEIKGLSNNEKDQVAYKLVKEAGGHIKISEELRDNHLAGKKTDTNDQVSVDNIVVRLLETDEVGRAERMKTVNRAAAFLISKLYEFNATAGSKNFAPTEERRYLAPIIFKLVTDNNYLKLNSRQDSNLTDFEKDYQAIYMANPKFAERIDFALEEAVAQRHLPDTKLDLKERIAYLKGLSALKKAKNLVELSEKSRDAGAKSDSVSKDEREKIEKTVNQLLEDADKTLENILPKASLTILKKLNESIGQSEKKKGLDANELQYLAPIVLKLVSDNDYLKLNKKGESEQTDFEKDYMSLIAVKPQYANRIDSALKAAEGQPPLSKNLAEITDRINSLKEIKTVKRTLEQEDPSDEESIINQLISERGNTDLKNMLEFFQEDKEAQRLSEAIFSLDQNKFWNYVRGIVNGNGAGGNPDEVIYPQGLQPKAEKELELIIEYKFKKKNLPIPNEEQRKSMLEDLTNQLLSEEIMGRCRDLMSKLYSVIDKISPREMSREAMSRGSVFKNPNILINNYIRRFDILQQYKTPEDLKHLTFWRQKQDEFTRIVDISNKGEVNQGDTSMDVKDGKVTTKTSYTYLHPSLRQEKIGSEVGFFRYVQNKVKSELEQRQIFHDLRANPFQSNADQKFWRRQQRIMEGYPMSEIDHFSDLKDIETIMQSARTWDKLNELNLARNNWTLTSLVDRPDPDTGWNKTDQQTHDYIMNMLAKKKADGKIINEEDLLRAINLGIAYNYGPALRAYTVPACADAGVDKAGDPNLQSFGQADSALFRVFNPQSFDQQRWSSQTAQEAGLLYTVLEDDNLEEYYQNWDYRKLTDEIRKHKASFVVGANPQDVNSKRVRYMDIINICKVGSMYDSDWRKSFSYEGWLRVEQKDVKASWIAMENIGIEAMKTFLTNDIEGRVDKNFYKDGTAAAKKRKEFVEFLFRRYFNPAEAPLTEEQIKAEVNKRFADMEVEKPNLGKKIGKNKYENVENGYAPKISRSSNYNEFYYEVLSRAIAKRMPTKFIRMEGERRRKVSSKRDTAMDAIFKIVKKQGLQTEIKDEKTWAELKAKGVDETEDVYFQALQDICASEALLREEVAARVKHDLKYNDGALHEIQIDNFELTPERLEELWSENNVTKEKVRLDGNDKFDAARKKNALTVLKATRAFIFSDKPLPGNDPDSDKPESKGDTFLKEFSKKYQAGPPLGAPFALGIEDMDVTLLAHAAQGERSNARVFGDIADSEDSTVDKMVEYYKVLRKVSKSSDRKYGDIVNAIKEMKSQISSMWGTEYANTFSRWMAIKAIAYFLIRSDTEGFMGWVSHVGGGHRSLAAQLGSAMPGEVWEWNKLNVWEFCNALSLAEVIPFQPYKTQKTPSMESLFKLAANNESFELEVEVEKNADKTPKLDAEGKPLTYKKPIERTREVTRIVDGKKKKVKEKWQRRKDDFENTATKLLEIFVKLPVKGEFLRRLGGPVLILILIWLLSNIFAGYKAGSGNNK